jgi:predicted PurR-regulated permease PerM
VRQKQQQEEAKMRTKTATAIVISITILFVLLVTKVQAEQVIPQPKPFTIKIQNWAQDEWNDIKTYQAENWADGKAQLNKNKEQVSNLFQNIADAISNIVTPDTQ